MCLETRNAISGLYNNDNDNKEEDLMSSCPNISYVWSALTEGTTETEDDQADKF